MKYCEIQNDYYIRTQKTISSCAIADAKRKLGYPVRVAKNRIDLTRIKKSASEFEIKEVKWILGGK